MGTWTRRFHRRLDQRAAAGTARRRRVCVHAQGPPDSRASGSPYLALELRDRSGTIQARAFRDADALAGRFERGELVRVVGRVERFRDELVLEVVDIARLGPIPTIGCGFGSSSARSGAVPADRLPGPRRARRVPRAPRARGARPWLSVPSWTRLLADRELRAAWRRAPCTRDGHHAYLGGLLEHTVAVATLAHELCQLHQRLNSDLLLTAALVHDLGRTREFTYGAEIGLTDEGRLLGHLVLGSADGLARAPAVGLTSGRLALLHCVLCHHGAGRGAGRALRVGRGARAVPAQRARRRGQGRARARPGGRDHRAVRRSLGSAAARHGPGGPSSLQNWQGRAAPGLEGSIPSPRRGCKSGVLGCCCGLARIVHFVTVSPICPENRVRFVAMQRATGHVFRVERKRTPVWYAKYRLPSGRPPLRSAVGRVLAGSHSRPHRGGSPQVSLSPKRKRLNRSVVKTCVIGAACTSIRCGNYSGRRRPEAGAVSR